MHVGHDTARIAQINPFCIARSGIMRRMTTTPADRLRRARIDAGFDTAESAALSRQWKPAGYRHHENGTREYFDIEQAVRYARAFKVDLAWLLGLSDMQTEQRQELNAKALGQVIEALLLAYVPNKRLAPDELLGLGEALKETLQEMMDDPDIGLDADRSAFVAKAVLRARRRAGQ